MLKEMAKRRGRRVKQQRSLAQTEDEALVKAPHCFVVHRGTVAPHVEDLERDLRSIFEPYTASSLKVRKSNTIKDYLQVCGVFGVTNMLVFGQSDKGINLRLGRVPRGPSVTFRVKEYSLARDVRSALRKQMVYERLNLYPPLLVLSGLTATDESNKHLTLVSKLFQNMFPTINVASVELKKILRVVLVNFDHEEKCLNLRHYAIKIVPVANRAVKKLVSSKVPDLSKYKDMTDFVARCGMLSESEAEDDPDSHVQLPQEVSQRGNVSKQVSSIRLIELGPRLKLEVMKIEDDLFKGEVLYHSIITKSPEELAKIKKFREEKKRVKEERRRQQEENVRRKKELEEAKEEKEGTPDKVEDPLNEDKEWFKKEVGVEPDKELFPTRKRRKRKVEEEPEIDEAEQRKIRRKEEEKKRKEEFEKKMKKLKAKRKHRQQVGSKRHRNKARQNKRA